jgi:hypothetical protein
MVVQRALQDRFSNSWQRSAAKVQMIFARDPAPAQAPVRPRITIQPLTALTGAHALVASLAARQRSWAERNLT